METTMSSLTGGAEVEAQNTKPSYFDRIRQVFLPQQDTNTANLLNHGEKIKSAKQTLDQAQAFISKNDFENYLQSLAQVKDIAREIFYEQIDTTPDEQKQGLFENICRTQIGVDDMQMGIILYMHTQDSMIHELDLAEKFAPAGDVQIHFDRIIMGLRQTNRILGNKGKANQGLGAQGWMIKVLCDHTKFGDTETVRAKNALKQGKKSEAQKYLIFLTKISGDDERLDQTIDYIKSIMSSNKLTIFDLGIDTNEFAMNLDQTHGESGAISILGKFDIDVQKATNMIDQGKQNLAIALFEQMTQTKDNSKTLQQGQKINKLSGNITQGLSQKQLNDMVYIMAKNLGTDNAISSLTQLGLDEQTIRFIIASQSKAEAKQILNKLSTQEFKSGADFKQLMNKLEIILKIGGISYEDIGADLQVLNQELDELNQRDERFKALHQETLKQRAQEAKKIDLVKL